MASYLWKNLLPNSTKSVKKIIQNPPLLNRNHWWSKTNSTKNDKIVRPGHYVVTKQIHPDIFPRQVILPPYAITGIPPPISNSMVSLLSSNIDILDRPLFSVHFFSVMNMFVMIYFIETRNQI